MYPLRLEDDMYPLRHVLEDLEHLSHVSRHKFPFSGRSLRTGGVACFSRIVDLEIL